MSCLVAACSLPLQWQAAPGKLGHILRGPDWRASTCRYLVEAPPNICTPTHIASAAQAIAESASDVMSCQILEEADCKAMGMGCFLGVAECSEEPLKFIHLTYKPKGELFQDGHMSAM